MSLTTENAFLLKFQGYKFAFEKGIDFTEVVVPQASLDFGFDFHPDQFLVNTVEVHTTEGCWVVVVDENYEVVDSMLEAFSYDF